MSDTITKLLVESMNQVHIAHSCYCCDHIACVKPPLPSKKLFEGKGSCTQATITILVKSSGSPVLSTSNLIHFVIIPNLFMDITLELQMIKHYVCVPFRQVIVRASEKRNLLVHWASGFQFFSCPGGSNNIHTKTSQF